MRCGSHCSVKAGGVVVGKGGSTIRARVGASNFNGLYWSEGSSWSKYETGDIVNVKQRAGTHGDGRASLCSRTHVRKFMMQHHEDKLYCHVNGVKSCR